MKKSINNNPLPQSDDELMQGLGQLGNNENPNDAERESRQRTKEEKDAIGETAVKNTSNEDEPNVGEQYYQSLGYSSELRAKINNQAEASVRRGMNIDDPDILSPEQSQQYMSMVESESYRLAARHAYLESAKASIKSDHAQLLELTRGANRTARLKERKLNNQLKRKNAILGLISDGSFQTNDPNYDYDVRQAFLNVQRNNVPPQDFDEAMQAEIDTMQSIRKDKVVRERERERYYRNNERNIRNDERNKRKFDDLANWEAGQQKDGGAQNDESIRQYQPTSGYHPIAITGKLDMERWIQQRNDARDAAKIDGVPFAGIDTHGNIRSNGVDVATEPGGTKGVVAKSGVPSPDSGDKLPQKPQPESNPLIAISINRTVDVQRLSRTEAQRRLNDELEANTKGKSLFGRALGGLKNMWKGNMMRGYYEAKYQQEAAKQLAIVESGDLSEADIKKRSETDPRYALVLRMIQDNDEYVRTTAGESRQLIDPAAIAKQLENEDLSPDKKAELEQQKEAYESIKGAIAAFSTKDDKTGEYLMDEASFDEAMKRADAMLHGDVDKSARATLSNYMSIAKYVRGQAEHGKGVAQVMEGFKLYAAESRAGVNGEVKMGKAAALAERLNNMKLFRKVPPEWTAAAASMALNAMPFMARSAAKAVPIVGGMAVTGVLAGSREAANISKDRATLERQLAEGGQNVDGRMNQKLAETMYYTVPASEQLQTMKQAMESGNIEQMAKALGDFTTRQEIGDRRGIDLFSFSSPNTVDQERMDLVTASLNLQAQFIQACKASGGKYPADWAMGMVSNIRKQVDVVEGYEDDSAREALFNSESLDAPSSGVEAVYRDVFAKDKKFNEIKRKAAIRQGIKAGLFAGAAGVAAQEAMAAFNPNVHGVIDELRGNADNAGAHDTLLTGTARHFGLIDEATTAVTPGASAAEHLTSQAIDHDLTPEEVAQYKAQGYDVDRIVNQVHEQTTESVSVDQAVGNNADFHRSGWFNNDTAAFDHNELSTYNNGNSMTFNPIQESWTGSNVLSVDQIQQMGNNGQIRLMLSPTAETQGKPFEVIGKLVNGQIQFDPEPGSPAAEMIANHSYKFAEVVDANNMVIGTDIGSGVSGNLPTTVDKVVDKISYKLTAPTSVEAASTVEKIPTIFDMPSVFPAVFGRRNLRNTVRPANEEPEQPTEVIPPLNDNTSIKKQPQLDIDRDENARPMTESEEAAMVAANVADSVMKRRRGGVSNGPQTINLDDIRTKVTANNSGAKSNLRARSTDQSKQPGERQSKSGFSSHDEAVAAMNKGIHERRDNDTGWWNSMVDALSDGYLDVDDISKLSLPGIPNNGDNPNVHLELFRGRAIRSGKLSDHDVDQLSRNGGENVRSIAISSGQLTRNRLQEMIDAGQNVAVARDAILANNYKQ